MEKILITEMISSDSSGVEDTISVLMAKEIPWRSQKVTNFFEKWINFMKIQSQSKPSARQSQGSGGEKYISSTSLPTGEIPKWAFSK